jgi:cysteinyl-tRNA synthetase
MEFSEDALQEAGAGFRRLESFVRHATERVGETEPGIACADFEKAMDGDFGVPAALAAIHDVARDGNKALASGDDAAIRGALASVRAMLAILGVDPLASPWVDRDSGDTELHDVVDALVSAQLEARAQARADKDFTTADAIRDSLAAAGIAIDDTADGARWSLLEEN